MSLTLALPTDRVRDTVDVLVTQSHRALDSSLRSFDFIMSYPAIDATWEAARAEYHAAHAAHRVAVHYLKEIAR